MSEYVSTRAALIRDIALAKAELKTANEVYDAAEKKSEEARKVSSRAYEAHTKAKLHFDRMNRALAIIEGHEE
jgi:hypothetical protein|tara:strand:- start:382 stop:600 length:219 start_codon:yes stop_codon:yes gene_type:complete